MNFSIPWGDNPDLDAFADFTDPEDPWQHVAVTGLWAPAERTRQRWPKASVVGPCRTERGIHLLIRSLLANPQIRVLVVEGRDLTPGETTRRALLELFDAGGDIEPVRAFASKWGLPFDQLVDLCCQNNGGPMVVDLTADAASSWAWDLMPTDVLHYTRSRPLDQHVLPPPSSAPAMELPAGDPGERLVADTLAELWPRILDRCLRFGQLAPTHYGPTKELQSLVTVIRDPAAHFVPLDDGEPRWPCLEGLPCTHREIMDYAERLMTPACPVGAEYSYGERMSDQVELLDVCLSSAPDYRGIFLTPWDHEDSMLSGSAPYTCWHGWREHPGDRKPPADCQWCDGAGTTPDTRRPKSGRPCLVGVQFRALPTAWTAWPAPPSSEERIVPRPVGRTLHMQVVFRSHDLYGGYPLNLAACCYWLTETAKQYGMEVGTVTCLSVSAHLYERDWSGAQQVVTKRCRYPMVDLDSRSCFVIDLVDVDGLPLLRATAMDPEGSGEVLEAFTAPSVGNLLHALHKSGLVTSISHAMWLGREAERVWRSR